MAAAISSAEATRNRLRMLATGKGHPIRDGPSPVSPVFRVLGEAVRRSSAKAPVDPTEPGRIEDARGGSELIVQRPVQSVAAEIGHLVRQLGSGQGPLRRAGG